MGYSFTDDIDEMLSRPGPKREVKAEDLRHTKEHVETCPKCRGTGRTRWGQCFKCRGVGSRKFKSSAASRQQNREKSAEKRQQRAEQNATDFATQHQDVAAWIASKTSFPFALAMAEAVRKHGELTEGQMAACRRCMERDAVMAQMREARRKEQISALDVSRIQAMFDRARRSGLKRIAVTIGAYHFSPAPAHGRNPGAVYVKHEGEYVGKVVGSEFQGRDVSPVVRAQLTVIAADPLAAAELHGKRTGRCSCCGAELTNKLSIELGIGPICRERFFG